MAFKVLVNAKWIEFFVFFGLLHNERSLTRIIMMIWIVVKASFQAAFLTGSSQMEIGNGYFVTAGEKKRKKRKRNRPVLGCIS